MLSHFSHVRFCVILWTIARPALLSMGLSRQEYWSGHPSPWDLPTPGIESGLLHCRQILYHMSHQGRSYNLLSDFLSAFGWVFFACWKEPPLYRKKKNLKIANLNTDYIWKVAFQRIMIYYTFYSFFIWKLLFLHIFLKECEKCTVIKNRILELEGALKEHLTLTLYCPWVKLRPFGSRILFAEKHGELMAPDPFSLFSPQVWGRSVQFIGRWTNVTWHSGNGMVWVGAGER